MNSFKFSRLSTAQDEDEQARASGAIRFSLAKFSFLLALVAELTIMETEGSERVAPLNSWQL